MSVEALGKNLVVGISRSIEPLVTAFTNRLSLRAFMYRLGWDVTLTDSDVPTIENYFSIVSALIYMRTIIEDLDNENTDELELVKELVPALINIIGLIKKLGQNNPNTLPAPFDGSNGFWNEFPEDLLNLLVVSNVAEQMPALYGVLLGMGIFDKKLVVPNGAFRVPFIKHIVYWDQIGDVFTDPLGLIKNTYKWGDSSEEFDYKRLVLVLDEILDKLHFPVRYNTPSRALLDAFFSPTNPHYNNIKELNIPLIAEVGPSFNTFSEIGIKLMPIPNKNSFNDSPVGFMLTPQIEGVINGSDNLNAPFRLIMKMDLDGSGSFRVEIRPSGTDLVLDPGITSLNALFGLQAYPEEPFILLGSPNSHRLELEGFFFSIGVEGRVDDLDVIFKIGTGEETTPPKLRIIIQTEDGDGFLGSILANNPISLEVSGELLWSLKNGIGINGGIGFNMQLPLHIDLGVLTIESLLIEAGLNTNGDSKLGFGTNLLTNLGPLKLTVENIGANLNLINKPDNSSTGIFGNLDAGFSFKPPNGIGLSIDAGVVKGGGYLFFDFDREEYAGALELIISEWIAVKAVGLVTTRLPDGSKGFSMVIIISVEFGTGIQLGLGFTLLGVGGLLGLNRTVNIDPLAEGVRTGAVENIMFPENVVANAPRIISDLRTFFPAKDGQFLIGPMAKIGYGTPTLVSLTLGVIIEFPDVSITILGVLKVALPDENAEVLKLQVNFIGRIEPSNKLLWFEARLFDSRILFMTIEGGMGLLVKWGDDSNFVFSVGGFHPRYNPPPLPFPEPPRLAITILNESYARIRIEGYFALTSNTVQFGARAELYFGFSFLNVDGHLSFDALFQFDPFYFIFEFSVGMSVKFFGFGLFSLSVSGLLEGPTRWHIKGKARWKITWFGPTIKVNIDETWGEDIQTELPAIEIFPLIEREFDAITNWEAVVPNNSSTLVTLRQLGDDQTPPSEDSETEARLLVLHPVGTLRISQRKVPIELVLDKFGNQRPADVNHFSVSANIPGGGGLAIDEVREQFAPAEFKDIDNSKKLSSPGFESYKSGIEIRPEGDQFQTSMAVKRNIRYETNIIDNNYKRFTFKFFSEYVAGFTVLLGALFTHFLKGSVVTKSTLSKHYQDQIQPNIEVIQVLPNQFSVANTQNNRPVLDGDGQTMNQFSSQMEATDFMKGQISQNPGLAAQMHVIPNTEINTAA